MIRKLWAHDEKSKTMLLEVETTSNDKFVVCSVKTCQKSFEWSRIRTDNKCPKCKTPFCTVCRKEVYKGICSEQIPVYEQAIMAMPDVE